ncbi:hypothetical protein DWV16_14115 [Anaerotruncus sp. AF02-27]|nr:hypothetical protein DWV16_14115 [Anaerotruncus sp. AF02-27]
MKKTLDRLYNLAIMRITKIHSRRFIMNRPNAQQNRFFGFFSWGFYFSTGFFCCENRLCLMSR